MTIGTARGVEDTTPSSTIHHRLAVYLLIQVQLCIHHVRFLEVAMVCVVLVANAESITFELGHSHRYKSRT